MWVYLLSILFMISADQWTKWWAVNTLMASGPKDFLGPILGFRYVENTGAAFSILRDKQLLLIGITFLVLLAMIGLLFKSVKTGEHAVVKWAYTLIIAGAIGNFIDRVRLDYVVDFLEFRFINFPIFNIADVLVVVGVGLLSIATFFLKYEF